MRNIYGTKRGTHNLKTDELKSDENCKVVGVLEWRRIVHLQTLGTQLFCKKCQCVLCLLNTTSEKHYGFASIFSVQCQQCKVITKVSTDKHHTSKIVSNISKSKGTDKSTDRCDTVTGSKCFATNTKAVIGFLTLDYIMP